MGLLHHHHRKTANSFVRSVDVSVLKLDDGSMNSQHLSATSMIPPSTLASSSSAAAPSTTASAMPATDLIDDDSSEDEFVEAQESSTAVSTPMIAQHSASTSDPPKRAARPIRLNRPLTYDEVYLSTEQLADDCLSVKRALQLFLNSRMIEAEQICVSPVPLLRNERSVKAQILRTLCCPVTFGACPTVPLGRLLDDSSAQGHDDVPKRGHGACDRELQSHDGHLLHLAQTVRDHGNGGQVGTRCLGRANDSNYDNLTTT